MEKKLNENDKVLIQGAQEGAKHSYSQDEVNSFAEHINYYLRDDPDASARLPIDPSTHQLFSEVGDGIIFCKLINRAQQGTIDERALNKKLPINIFQKNENLNLAINSARSIGCHIVNIHPNTIMDQKEHIILGFLWQIIKQQIIAQIDLKHHPYLIRLKTQNEELEDLLKLSKEQLLLRWFNYHLENAGHSRRVGNFDKDLADGENYVVLLNQLSPSTCDLSALSKTGLERAGKIIKDAQSLGVPQCIKPSDITNGIQKLNLLHCAHIFNFCPGLTAPTVEETNQIIQIDMDMEKDLESSRDERIFKNWVNCLNLDNGEFYCNNLYTDLRDGIVFGKILEHLSPGIIDPKKISLKTQSKINCIQNGNYIIEKARTLGLQIQGIGGSDLADANKKLMLAIIWQLMRLSVFKPLGDIKEDQLVSWANSKIPAQFHAKNLRDKSLKNSQFFLRLIEAIKPKVIDWSIIKEGDSPEDLELNAHYLISLCRKLGISVYCIIEHIKEVNQKFLLTLLASLKQFADQK